jgi:septal ring factor EnvC (AmiA/AmiB activator)
MHKSWIVVAAACLLLIASDGRSSTSPSEQYDQSVDARLLALDKTESLLDEKIASRREQLTERVRGLYKLSRGRSARLWIDPEERLNVVRRTAATRVVRREARELELIQREMDSALAARARIESGRADEVASIGSRSLFRPVVGGAIAARFGEYRDRSSRARLVRRGVEFATAAGRNVRAVADGEIVYVGPIRGLGTGVVVSHTGGFLSVVARVGEPKLSPGQTIARGDVIAEAAGDRVYLEIRLLAGPGGFPIDPAPLLAAR